MGYIYLIQEREFLTQNLPVYKIGKSTQENCRRLNSYPKGSKLIFCNEVNECHFIERELIILLKKKFIWRNDLGNEYFEGDLYEIKLVIFKHINIFDYKILPVIHEMIESIFIVIHYHPLHPENHNIKLFDIDDKFIDVYMDDKWQKIDENTIIKKSLKQIYRLLKNYINSSLVKKKLNVNIDIIFENLDTNSNFYKDLHNSIKQTIYKYTKKNYINDINYDSKI